MDRLGPAAFIAAIADSEVRLETERFGRTRPGASWALDRRRVAEHYLTLYLDGTSDVAAGNVAGPCAAGSGVLVAPGVAHSIAPADGRFTFYHWRFRLWRGRRELRLAADAVLHPRPGGARALLDQAYDEQLTAQPFRALRQRALLAAVLAALLRPTGPGQRGLDPGQRDAVLALVARRLPAPLHPAELAAACGLSHDYFTRRFRASFGAAPRSWLLAERLRHAAEDLAGSGDAIGVVAARWGFDSVFVFSRQFKAAYGSSPSAWRGG